MSQFAAEGELSQLLLTSRDLHNTPLSSGEEIIAHGNAAMTSSGTWAKSRRAWKRRLDGHRLRKVGGPECVTGGGSEDGCRKAGRRGWNGRNNGTSCPPMKYVRYNLGWRRNGTCPRLRDVRVIIERHTGVCHVTRNGTS